MEEPGLTIEPEISITEWTRFTGYQGILQAGELNWNTGTWQLMLFNVNVRKYV